MNDIEILTKSERLLLMAAAVHGLGPGTDLTRANAARVVNQALIWTGLSSDKIRQGWECPEANPIIEETYNALVRMTRELHRGKPGRNPERIDDALFEGGGNWGVPCDPNSPAAWPQFNSCRLTANGERIARELLERHPEYRKVR